MKKLLFILLLCLSPVVMWGQTTNVRYVNPSSSAGGDGTTNATSGTSRAYHSLSEWENARQGDLVSLNTIEEVVCEGSTADDHSLAIIGWTTGENNYIYIHPSLAYRHNGKWDDSKYHLSIVNETCIESRVNHLRIDGLQISISSPSGNGLTLIGLNNGYYSSGANDIRISNCILKGSGSGTYTERGINANSNNLNLKIWNTILYSISTLSGSYGIYASGTNASTYIYSSMVIGGEYTIRRDGGTLTVKNTYAGGASLECFVGTITQTTNASSDTTATGTALDSIAVNTTNFTNVTAGSEDYRLPGTGSALYNVGTDTSGDSAPLNFTTDIQGGTRSGTWDIGADEYGVDGSTTTTSSTSTAATTSTSTTSTAADTTTTSTEAPTTTSSTSTTEAPTTTLEATSTSTTTSTTTTTTTTSTVEGATTSTIRKKRMLTMGVG